MATYQQGDYISQIKPSEPALAFDAQVLQTKQTKYDANHKKISQLYGSVLNSELSRNPNIQARDEFFKTIQHDIRKMAGMDFSLDANVNSAATVFKSIYNNDNIVKDMVFTKDFREKYTKFQALKDCSDPEACGGQWWDGGDKYMQYKMQEFREASNEEAMSFGNVDYVPYTNMTEKAMKYFKDNKLGITTNSLEGNYMVTTTNGEQAVKPLTELFSQLYGNDPKLLKQYEVMAYVNRKDSVRSIMAETGMDENTATSQYLNKVGTAQQEQIDELLDHVNSDENYIKDRMSVLESKLKTNKFGPSSAIAQEYQRLQQLLPSAQQASQYIKSAKLAAENANSNSAVSNIASRYDQRAGAILMNQEIQGAAQTIASTTMEQEVKVDELAKMRIQHSYNVALEGVRSRNAIKLQERKAELDSAKELTKENAKQKYDVFGRPVSTTGGSTTGTKSGEVSPSLTVSGFIEEAYKSTKDPKKILGGYETKIQSIKDDIKSNAGQSSEILKGYEQQLAYWTALNTEKIVRKTAEELDKIGVTNKLGVSFKELNLTDRKLTGRTSDVYSKLKPENVSDFNSKSYSKSIADVYDKIVANKPKAVEEVINSSMVSLLFEDSNIFNTVVRDIKENNILTPEQRKFYEKVSAPGHVLTEKEAGFIANRLNHTQAAVNAELKPDYIKKKLLPKDVTSNTLSYIKLNHDDDNVVVKYDALMKKGVENLTVDERNSIANRYNELIKKETADNKTTQTGSFSVSNESSQARYAQLYNHVYTDMYKASSTINNRYINEIKPNSPEEKELLKFGYKYLQKYAENTGVSFSHKGKEYNEDFWNNAITKDELSDLIENDKNFSKSIYQSIIKNKVQNSSFSNTLLKDNSIIESVKVFDEMQGYFKSIYDLKANSSSAILSKVRENVADDLEVPFSKEVIKNGFLVSESKFKNLMENSLLDDDEIKEEYHKYRIAYNDAVSAVLKEKEGVTKAVKESGLGSWALPKFEADNVNPTIKSSASDEVNEYIGNFKTISPESRKIFVKSKLGVWSELSDSPDEVQKTLADLRSKNENYNMRYQINGINQFKNDPLNNATDNTDLTWEGMYLMKDDGSVIFMANDPKVKASQAYITRTIPIKQQVLLQTGKVQVASGNEFTNNKPVYAYVDSNGSIQLEGELHIEGENVDINMFRNKWDEMSMRSFTDAEQASIYVNDLINTLK